MKIYVIIIALKIQYYKDISSPQNHIEISQIYVNTVEQIGKDE